MPRTSPAIWTGNSEGSNAEMRRTPLRALRNPSQSSSFELPRGVRQPKPLITILSGSTSKSYTGRIKPQLFPADKTSTRPKYGHSSDNATAAAGGEYGPTKTETAATAKKGKSRTSKRLYT